MKLIYLIAGTYRAAGMEKVLADKANWLVSHGYEVMVVTTDQEGREGAFPMDPSIRQVDLGIGYERTNGKGFLRKAVSFPLKQLRHRRKLSRLLKQERADVVVSMFCNDASFLPRIKDGSRKVLEVHFSRFKRLQYGRRGIWAAADRYMSRQDLRHVRAFDRFVVLTEEDKGYWGGLDNIVVIPNSVPRREQVRLTDHRVIAVGRLSYQKAIDRLVEAWSRAERRDWTLSLVGDGECREDIERLIAEKGLGDCVELKGVVKDMDSVYKGASLLALSSRYEGLPMVLLEAQSYGIPAVSFDCKCGPKDVIRDGENGLLVPEGDIDALAKALSRAISDPEGLRRMGDSAYARSLRWEPETIMRQWDRLFQELI